MAKQTKKKPVDGVATAGSVPRMKAARQSFVFGHPTLSQYNC
jgi:hypothetical protein